MEDGAAVGHNFESGPQVRTTDGHTDGRRTQRDGKNTPPLATRELLSKNVLTPPPLFSDTPVELKGKYIVISKLNIS